MIRALPPAAALATSPPQGSRVACEAVTRRSPLRAWIPSTRWAESDGPAARSAEPGLRSRWRRNGLVSALAVLLAWVPAGCADNDLTEVTLNQPTGAGDAAPELTDMTGQERVEVVVTDNVFTPRHIEISVGTTVVWINKGRNSHNVMPSEGDEFPKTDLPVGGQVEVKFDQLGTVPYYCTIHGSKHRGQTGTIVVVA